MDANILNIIADYLPISDHVTMALVFGDQPFFILRRRYAKCIDERFHEISSAYILAPFRRGKKMRRRVDVILSAAIRGFIVPYREIMFMVTSSGQTVKSMILAYIHAMPVE